MVKLKCWKLRDKTPDALLSKKMGIFSRHWRHKNGDDVTVGDFYPDVEASQDGYEVHVHSDKEFNSGYPNSKVGITKKEALKLATKYMKDNDKC